VLVGGVEDEAELADEVFELGEDFGGEGGRDGGGPFGGCEVVGGGGFDGEQGIVEKASRGLEAVEGVSGEERFRGPVLGIVDMEGPGELGGCRGDAGQGFVQGMLGWRAFGDPAGGFGGAVHGNGEFAEAFHKRMVLGFTEGWNFLLVVDGLVGEGVEFVDVGLHGSLLLRREWWGGGLAALEAESFAFLTPDFVKVLGVVAEHAGLDAVEEKIHSGGFGVGLRFESALGLVVGVVDGGEFHEAVGEGGAEGVCKIEHGGAIGLMLGGLVLGRHGPSGFWVDGNFKSSGLDNDASVGVAEPFEVEGIGPVVGNGAILPVEGGEFLERAIEDLDFVGGGDVTNVSGLLTNESGNGFAGRTGGWIFENDAMACEVAPRVANQVKDEGFLVAGEVENAGSASRVAVIEFAVEDFGAEAEGHGEIKFLRMR